VTNDYLSLTVKFDGLDAQNSLFLNSTIVRISNHDAFFLFLSLTVIYRLSERVKINEEINY